MRRFNRQHCIHLVSCISFYFFFCALAVAQAEQEIQVYASPTIKKNATIFELHTNYTIEGMKGLADPKSVRNFNATLEITHGLAQNFELGFYLFTSLKPDGSYEFLGSQIRPRVTVPSSWNWPVGASLSTEFGFFRADADDDFFWQGEIRPIIDKTFNNLYLSLNPNIDFVISGENKRWGLSPQFKAVYTIKQKYGFGFEYYGSLGTFETIPPIKEQEHLLGPMIDLYIDPKWEFNGGYLFGLTPASNQRIVKLLLGRRIGL